MFKYFSIIKPIIIKLFTVTKALRILKLYCVLYFEWFHNKALLLHTLKIMELDKVTLLYCTEYIIT